jgi:hypothetical protein
MSRIVNTIWKIKHIVVATIVWRPENGGFLNFTNPDLNHLEITPFWQPDLCPHILHADIVDVQYWVQPFMLNLTHLDCEILTLKKCPDLTHYMFRDGRKFLQICYRDNASYYFGRERNILKLVFQMGDMTDYRGQDLARKRLRYLAEMGCLPDHLFKANKASCGFN